MNTPAFEIGRFVHDIGGSGKPEHLVHYIQGLLLDQLRGRCMNSNGIRGKLVLFVGVGEAGVGVPREEGEAPFWRLLRLEAQRFSISGVAAEAADSAVLVVHQAGMVGGSTRQQEDLMRAERLGTALKPANSACPSPQVSAMIRLDPSELHSEQRPKGALGRDYLASRHAASGEQVVEPEPGQIFC
ncbi:MAG: hypothetical protein OXI87_18285 [Albidovulum sp.]|nr:hypothetical protein [Albidovulum sp.]